MREESFDRRRLDQILLIKEGGGVWEGNCLVNEIKQERIMDDISMDFIS